jgi:peptidoglycan biosynthesis protein MviN/MurJ (putative lipid II flippase)
VTVSDTTSVAERLGPFDGELDLSSAEGAVGDSLSVAVWTIISRCTGVLRGIVVAAVLGATFFANTYQFTNTLPNLIFYGLLAGALFSSILVPALVRHVDSGDSRAAARTAGGLLGVAMIGMVAIVPIVALATPFLLRFGSGATSAAAAHSQARIGAILVLLLLPQVALYAVVGTATAVQNSHRRFALAAAAPALENIGTIAVLAVALFLYTRSAREHQVPLSLVLLLGAGTTGAVLLHASAQWWGARRVGVVLIPRPISGWRDPEVRAIIQRARPAAVQAGMEALQLGGLLLVADRVAGGVVAFQLATNFFFLPVALGATPVALSLMPRLSRMTGPGQERLYRNTYVQGLLFAAFLVIPAATAYAVLARPLASAIGFGGFSASSAHLLIAASLIGLAPGIIGQTLFLVTTYACYARGDTTYPLRGMLLQATVCAGIVIATYRLHGPALLTALGLALSAGTLTGSAYLVRHLRRDLPRGGVPWLLPLLRTLAGTAIMIGPAWATATFLDDHVNSKAGHVAAMLAAVVVGAGIYFGSQALMHAPQMGWIYGALARFRGGGGLSPRVAAAAALPVQWTLYQPISASPVVWPALIRLRRDIALLLGCVVVGALVAVSPKYAVAAMILIGIVTLVVTRPQWAAYLLIFLTPLIVGVDVGAANLRPNEALLVLFGLIIAVRWLVRVRSGERLWPKIDRIDVTLIALGLTSSVLPLLMMVARQRPITSSDILYCFVMWKLLAEYVVVRSVIKTREQAMRCLWLSMWSAAIVCVIGILQALSFGPVLTLLAKYYAPLGVTSAVSIGRGSSLLALPAAVADLAILNLAIAIAMITRGHPRRLLLAGFSVIYALGVVAAAEFSTMIGLLVALAVIVVLTKSGRIVLYAAPVALIGGLLLWPVIEIRLGGFQGGTHLPYSWVVRLNNLRTYFWPTLFSDWNWILGVRPDARIPVANQEYGYVWIESGYTWLLWGGGIPLLVSYLAFAWATIRKGFAYARRRADSAGIVGFALAAAMSSQVVMMIFDPHLTYRGSGDAIFLILGLLRILPGRKPRESGAARGIAEVADPGPRPQGALV